MKHGSLFSGIGGFDLAAEWMGWSNIFHCEWNDFGKRILDHYWPNAISYNDITTTDFRQHHGQIDILTGGFPCQPYSAAGKRKGKDDDRHLWPHMLRCIREVKPRWVVGENVFGLATWNGGLVFEEVCSELETEGYAVQPFVLPAAAVNAPHRRDRIWFVAYRANTGTEGMRSGGQNAVYAVSTSTDADDGRAGEKIRRGNEQTAQHGTARSGDKESSTDATRERSRQFTSTDSRWQDRRFNHDGPIRPSTDAEDSRCRRRNGEECADGRERVLQNECKRSQMGSKTARCCGERDVADSGGAELQRGIKYRGIGAERAIEADGRQFSGSVCTTWQDFPTQSPICGGDDGLPAQLDGITFPKWRAESIKGYGNAIVPQVALQIFRAIEQYEHNTNFGEHQ